MVRRCDIRRSEVHRTLQCYDSAANVELGVQAEGPGSLVVRAARRSGVDLRPLIATMAPNPGLELEVLLAKADLKKED